MQVQSEQNISKLNPTTDKTDHAPQPNGIHPKLTFNIFKVSQSPHKQKKRQKYMVISIEAEKTFDKIQYLFRTKILTKVGIKGIYLNIIKSHL